MQPFLHRRGFTLAEALIAVVIVGIACSAMMYSVGDALSTSGASVDTSRSGLLAQDLMNEICTVAWADADLPDHWGPESGETNSKTRVDYDDLDDYDGWVGPPQTRDGFTHDQLLRQVFRDATCRPYAKYTCGVRVRYIDRNGAPLPTSQVSAYRLVTVTVSHTGRPSHELTRVFVDQSGLLGSDDWFDPNLKRQKATVQYIQ
jgi:prepilin-type N-terminal cleavage/methylation domain-containing protein